MACLTLTDLQNANLDTAALSAIINGPATGPTSTVTTRLGTSIFTLARVLSSLNPSSLLTTKGDLFGFGTGNARVAVGANKQVLTADSTNALGVAWKTVREVLTAGRTYFVSNSGNDGNDGLTAGTAFATIQMAINTVAALDISIYNVNINVATGTYTSGAIVNGPWTGTGNVYLNGYTANPAGCLINVTNAYCIIVQNGGRLIANGFKFQTNTNGSGILVSGQSSLSINGNVDFGNCAWFHVQCITSYFSIATNYLISGSAFSHWEAEACGHVNCAGYTIGVSNTPNFSQGFAQASACSSMIIHANTFTGSGATGSRFLSRGNSNIFTSGAGSNYLPGNSAGTTSNADGYT